MKASNIHYKGKVEQRNLLDPALAEEINIFEQQIDLRKAGKLDEKLFAETRLRRGAYGQRYDNGQRHDGVKNQSLDYPTDISTKGPNTLWHAPGMLRIKIPYGGLNPEQCDVLAEIAEEYSDNILHVTTRQDFQVHFIHIDDTPAIMRRLAEVGITTREACGNSVRNITACPLAGGCQDEVFDTTPHAHALTYFLLGHHDVQDFGRKFKVSFSGCQSNSCGLGNIHDLAFIAKEQDGVQGFRMLVGGGLGAVPHNVKLLYEFVAGDDIFALTQAIARVFARLGEKKNRARARVKFLVAKLGIDEFKKLVEEERKVLVELAKEEENDYAALWAKAQKNAEDTKSQIQDLEEDCMALEHIDLSDDSLASQSEEMRNWHISNVYKQKQDGYCIVTVKLPLGDLTPQQMRGLGQLARKYTSTQLLPIRTTIEQNIVLKWIKECDLPGIYEDLKAMDLHEAGAGGITDMVACPGTDTCKLGISSSRGLVGELRQRFSQNELSGSLELENLRIKASGCFNSCAQHHVAELGFYGVTRKIEGRTVPHFQIVLGGRWDENGGSYGLPIMAVPSKNIPTFIENITDFYKKERTDKDEKFYTFIQRVGKAKIKEEFLHFTKVPSYNDDKSFYVDWGDDREYSTGDMGIGECAGEVVTRVEMDLAAAEVEIFECQLLLEKEKYEEAVEKSFIAMMHGAKALVKLNFLDVPEDRDIIVKEFTERFYDTEMFFDPYARSKFANYFLNAHKEIQENNTNVPQNMDKDTSRQRVEEASLFMEACHSCYARLDTKVKA